MNARLFDTATRLAMLGERIAKLNAQIGRGLLAARARRALAEADAEFERGLRDLSAAPLPAEIRDNYRLLRHLWDEYRVAAAQPPSPDNARRLAERNEELVWIASKGARMLQPMPGTGPTQMLLAAGSARTAAQRIAKVHLLRGWALGREAGARELEAAEEELDRALARLEAGAQQSDEIALALRMAQGQWAFMRQAIERLAAGRDRALQLEHIAKTADHIAETMDRVARLQPGASAGH